MSKKTKPIPKPAPNQALSASHLRAARAFLNWTQTEASKRIDITQASLSMIEQEAVDPRYSTFSKIADTYREAGVEFKTIDGKIFVG